MKEVASAGEQKQSVGAIHEAVCYGRVSPEGEVASPTGDIKKTTRQRLACSEVSCLVANKREVSSRLLAQPARKEVRRSRIMRDKTLPLPIVLASRSQVFLLSVR